MIGAPSAVLSVGVAICAAYLGTLSIAAVATLRRRQSAPDTVRAHSLEPLEPKIFVIFVPAYNEATVIERSIEAMMAMDYPKDRYSVHVVADNCTDSTAALARSLGATVHERTDAERPGKGPALNWLFEQVDKSATFDAVAVIDADTVTDPGFLTAMSSAMALGADVTQGRYDVIETSASTAGGIRAAALASRHHLRPLGRNALGGSSGLYGNGMVFDRSILVERSWSGHLVEDAEFQNELLLDGMRVTYVPGARVFAEMPDTLDASTTQNERWELGRLQVARRYVPRLLSLVATDRADLRVARLDAVADHLVPPLSVFVAANGLGGAGAFAAWFLRRSAVDRLAVTLSLASGAVFVGHVLVALRLAGAPKSTYRALAAAPRAIIWKLGLWARVLVRPESVAWVRTERNEPHHGL